MIAMPTGRARARKRYAEQGQLTDELLDRQLEQAAASRGSRTAIVDGAHRLTYADLFRRVESLAHAMRERGIGPGDVVSFQLPNWWEASVVHFATIRLGAVSNPLVPILRHRELEFMLRQADSKMLFVPSRHRGFDYAALASRLCHELPSLEAMVVVRGAHGRALTFDGLLEAGAPFAEPAGATGRSADDPALLMYTSGTESRPKGVVHSHNGLVYENRTMIVRYALSDRDAVFMPSPVTHISGLLYGIHLPVALRTKVALLDQWRPERGRDLVSAENCTFTVGATPFLNGLVDAEPEDGSGSSLRYFVCGGADVPPHLVRLADEKLKCVVVRAYGSTEFPTLSAGSPGDSVERRANTDGQIIGAAEARVMTDDGTVAPPGVAGDLYVRGPKRSSAIWTRRTPRRRSVLTAGSAPVIRPSSTRRATSASRAGPRTSSFVAVRTSARKRWRKSSANIRPSGRSPLSRCPTRSSPRRRAPSSCPGPAPHSASATSSATWSPPAPRARSSPSDWNSSSRSPRRPAEKFRR